MIWTLETNLLFNIADRKLLLVCSPCPTADCQNKTKWPITFKKCFLEGFVYILFKALRKIVNFFEVLMQSNIYTMIPFLIDTKRSNIIGIFACWPIQTLKTICAFLTASSSRSGVVLGMGIHHQGLFLNLGIGGFVNW